MFVFLRLSQREHPERGQVQSRAAKVVLGALTPGRTQSLKPKRRTKLESQQPLVSEGHGLSALTLTSNTECQLGPPKRSEIHSCRAH